VPASEILLTGDIYTQAALEQTSKAFAQHCSVSIEAIEDRYVVRFPAEHALDSAVVYEFLNYALVLSAQERLS
jgi:hypothetical protein